MEKNYLSGRLEFNPVNHTWYLIDLTGSELLKSDPASSFAARPLHENIFDPGVNAHSIALYKNSFAANLSANSSLRANSLELATNHCMISKVGHCFARQDKPEAAITRQKNPRRLRSKNATAGIISFALAALSSTALVNPVIAGNILPQGGVVASGSGSISSVNNGTGLQIKQNSQVLGLNWNSFSIGVGNKVIFDQPSSTSVAINRVVGNSRSEIFGSIQSNGQVFLLNPNGVLLARTAQIDTGAFVAAAAQDAKRNTNGSWTVSGISNAEVINQGNIRANGQGGFVVLAGAQVSNEGSLQASSGVALAAGESVSLALDNNQLLTVKVDGAKLKALVQNKGIILADGGAVYLTASGRDTLLGTVVNNEGIIQARGVSNKGGRIILSGIGGDVLNSGKLDVSGKAKGTKGGLVALNGNRVAVTGNAEIDASGVAGGGRVIIGGDQLGKATDVINVTLSDHTVIGPNNWCCKYNTKVHQYYR